MPIQECCGHKKALVMIKELVEELIVISESKLRLASPGQTLFDTSEGELYAEKSILNVVGVALGEPDRNNPS